MEPPKTITFSFNHFDLLLTPLSEKVFNLTAIDPLQKIQFETKQATLNAITVPTLIKAFEKSLIQIKADIKVEKGEETVLKIEVLIASQFLKPLEEVIIVKKKRNISEAQVLGRAVDQLSRKIKKIKQKNEETPNSLFSSSALSEKTYNSGTNYEEIKSVKLKKGKYLLTMSFMLKATSQWIYLYLNKGTAIMQNCGFYEPTTSNYVSHIIKKVHTVNADNQNVQISSYYGQTYPVTIRNFILTAKRIDQ